MIRFGNRARGAKQINFSEATGHPQSDGSSGGVFAFLLVRRFMRAFDGGTSLAASWEGSRQDQEIWPRSPAAARRTSIAGACRSRNVANAFCSLRHQPISIMNSDSTHSIRWLLEQLADPFAILPLQDVARSLSDSIAESEESFQERSGPDGVARKFWDVPMELLDEGIGVAIGSAFVLGQAAIVQTVSIVTQIRKLSDGHTAIPNGKRTVLETETTYSCRPEVSDMVAIDTAANYFKHRHEWPADWQETTGKGVQQRTMFDAKLLGMAGHDLTANMHVALAALRIGTDKISSLPITVHDWRERLAARLSRDLGIAANI